MGNQSACILGVVIIFLWFPGNTLAREDGEYEFLKLVSLWTPSYCNRKSPSCRSNFNRFVISMFVPMYEPNMIVPPFNDSGCELVEEPKQLDPSDFVRTAKFGALMEAYWPSLEGDHFTLWDKQWNEFGKCFNTPSEPLLFFKTAVSLEVAFHILDTLGKKGIHYAAAKHRTYDVADIKSALQRFLGVQEVNIICNKDDGGVIQLFLVVACFNRGRHKARDCEPLTATDDLCAKADHGMIAFPPATIQV